MSMYALAFQQGAGAAQLALTGENAATNAAYNASYNTETRKQNALRTKLAAEQNIANVAKDKALAVKSIQQKQMQAEASVLLAAAVAGAEGGSVDHALNDTTESAQQATKAVENSTASELDRYLAQVNAAESAFLGVREQKPDLATELINAMGSVSADDVQRFQDQYNAGAD